MDGTLISDTATCTMKKTPVTQASAKASIFASVSAPLGPDRKSYPKPAAQSRRKGLARLMLLYFLLFSLVPLGVVGTLNFINARQAILEDRLEFLEAIATRQINEILSELEDIDNIVLLISESREVREALQAVQAVDVADWDGDRGLAMQNQIERQFGDHFRQLCMRLGLSEFYLVNRNSVVAYAEPAMAAEYRMLEQADNRDGQMARIVRRTLSYLTTQAGDLRDHPASGQPALFLSAPVFADGILLGVVVVSVDNQTLDEMLNDYSGLGRTGEVLFGSIEGDDILILNNPRYQNDRRPERRLARQPRDGEVPSPMQRAVEGENGAGIAMDSLGREVVAIWHYLPNLRIGLVIQMDRREVFAPVIHLAKVSFWIAVVTALLVAAAAVVLSRGISRPIIALTAATNRLAQGDLAGDVTIDGKHEIGQLALSVRTMAANLKSLVSKVKTTAAEISRTSVSIAGTSDKHVRSAEQTGAAVTQVNAAAKQISTTARELAETMAQVGQLTQETADRAETGFSALQSIEATMKELAEGNEDVSSQLHLIQDKAQAITGVIATMTKMADQANLLSLNAAIEARKAGDYGKGFSVVALEIRELADQAAVSTQEIEASIVEMTRAVGAGVTGVRRFSAQVDQGVEDIVSASNGLSGVIQRVQGLPPRFDQVREGMESQAEGASQINEAMVHLNDSAQQTIKAVKEINRMLDNLRRSADMLQAEVSRFKT